MRAACSVDVPARGGGRGLRGHKLILTLRMHLQEMSKVDDDATITQLAQAWVGTALVSALRRAGTPYMLPCGRACALAVRQLPQPPHSYPLLLRLRCVHSIRRCLAEDGSATSIVSYRAIVCLRLCALRGG